MDLQNLIPRETSRGDLSEERRFVSGGFLTANPEYWRYFRSLLKVLLSHGEGYTPQFIELGKHDNYKTIPFETGKVEELAKKWDTQTTDTPGWDLQKHRPNKLSVMISRLPLRFNFVDINVERDYLKESPNKIGEFLEILGDFYNILHPSYGYAFVRESIRMHEDPLGLGRLDIGTDIERALPDIYWCNLFGPEYVEMFGQENISSVPCYSIERLQDGGARLLLSASPLDYLEDPSGFEKHREEVKAHLGVDAFDTGDLHYRGRVPKLRYLEERKRALAAASLLTKTTSPDWLSRVRRSEWEDWLRYNLSLSEEFVSEEKRRDLTLDYSEESLRKLDEYLHNLNQSESAMSMEFLKKVSAYVSQVIIRNTGATWRFQTSDDIPSLWLGDVQISPLARSQKVLLEDETFEHWYRFITKELIPAIKRDKTLPNTKTTLRQP